MVTLAQLNNSEQRLEEQMHALLLEKQNRMTTQIGLVLSLTLMAGTAFAQQAAYPAPIPGYVPPMTVTQTPDYADDTRGVFVPSHAQHRLRTYDELNNRNATSNGPLYAQASPRHDQYEQELNRISNGYVGYERELNRIAADPGLLETGPGQPQAQGAPMYGGDMGMMPSSPGMPAQGGRMPQAMPQGMPYGVPMAQQGAPTQNQAYTAPTEGGVEIARGNAQRKVLDMNNSLVRLQEDRITVRRALQRMMDQIGGGDWTIVWDLAEQNAGLPEMEISVYAEEPFANVLNALLARIQTRSGQPLRVIRYDNTQRMVITDRAGGHRLAGKTSPVGVGDVDNVAVTENVLKEAMVSLHHDEIPLVDALENIVNQAGKGEWRLRVYAGMDQVLKPAHIEEPFAIAMERLLKLFDLKYEVFPGGKLIVVTHTNRFGYNGINK